jgi:hypothetical protein
LNKTLSIVTSGGAAAANAAGKADFGGQNIVDEEEVEEIDAWCWVGGLNDDDEEEEEEAEG